MRRAKRIKRELSFIGNILINSIVSLQDNNAQTIMNGRKKRAH